MLYVYLLGVFAACCIFANIWAPSLPTVQGTGSAVEIPSRKTSWEASRDYPPQQNVPVSGTEAERLRLSQRKKGNLPLISLHLRQAENPSGPRLVARGFMNRHPEGPAEQRVVGKPHPPLENGQPSLRFSFLQEREDELQACVIPNVCMEYNMDNKRVYIPDSYRTHKHLLRRCVHPAPAMQFYDPANPPPELRHAIDRRQAIDAIGMPLNSLHYSHFAHFIMAFTRRVAVSLSLFLRHEQFLDHWLCSEDNKGTLAPCKDVRALSSLKPRLVLSEDVLGKPKSWNRAFLALLTGGSLEHPEHVHLVPAKQWLVCVRTLLTSPLQADTSEKKRDVIFREAGLSRKQISTCAPRILVIVRNPKASIGRTIPEASVRRLRAELSKGIPGGSVEVVHGLHGWTLQQQAALMQRTDVLMTVHGAELSNSIFLQRGASVIEVFPFGYHSRWFSLLLKAVGATHVQLGAKPEKERYLNCLEQFRPVPKSLAGLRNKFLRQVGAYEKASTDEEREKASLYYDAEPATQVCARKQRIHIDPVKIAAIAAREARKKCEEN